MNEIHGNKCLPHANAHHITADGGPQLQMYGSISSHLCRIHWKFHHSYILFRAHLSLTVYCLCMPKLLLYFSLKQFIRTICMHWPIDLYYYYNVYVHKIAANILWFGQSFRGKLMHRLTEEKHAESIKIFSSNWIMWRMFIELIVLLLLNIYPMWS